MWSKNVNEIVSTHGYSQNQVVVWKYPGMTKLVSVNCQVVVWKYPGMTKLVSVNCQVVVWKYPGMTKLVSVNRAGEWTVWV